MLVSAENTPSGDLCSWSSSMAPHAVLLLFVVVGTLGSAVPAFPGAILIFVGALVHVQNSRVFPEQRLVVVLAALSVEHCLGACSTVQAQGYKRRKLI